MKGCLFILLAVLLCSTAYALKVEKVSFNADFAVEDDALLRATAYPIGEEYDPTAVETSINSLQSWLQANGHPFVKISYPELIPLSEASMELRFTLTEVLAVDKVSLSFKGLRYFTEAKLRSLLLLEAGKQVSLDALPSVLRSVLNEYQKRSYLFATVQVDSLVLEKGLVAYIGVEEGKPLKPEKYYVQGNKYTQDKTLIKLSGLGQITQFSPEALRTAEQNILRKNYITDCQILPLDPASILIRVEEGKMAYLEGVLGLSQRNGKTELTGLLRLQFLNLWGSDRAVSLNWQKNTQRNVLELGYHESGPLNFPLSGDLLLSRTVQDTTWVKSSLSAEIYSYNANQKYGLELSAQGIAPGSRRPPTISRSASRSAGLFWRLDSRDQVFNPFRGMQTDLTYRVRYSDTGTRWSNALEVDHTQYLGISSRWSAAVGAHLRSYAQPDTTDFVQYRMGGFNSLRGYREDEYSSWRLAWLNAELRYLISPLSRVYLFYDHGAFSQADDTLRYNVFAPGIGIKVQTKLGILSIEYALGYRDGGFSNLGAGMIHAGLDASF